MDRHASPTPAPAADHGPAVMFQVEAPTLPPLYRSEGFAEDLLDGEAPTPARLPRTRLPRAWLYALPMVAAIAGALATTLVAPA
jgi:hypothetical protein